MSDLSYISHERPSYIPESIYNGYCTRATLDKYFQICSSSTRMRPSSFVLKCKSLHDPIPSRSPRSDENFSVLCTSVYSCLDVINRAFRDGYFLSPIAEVVLQETKEGLEVSIENLKAEIFALEVERSSLRQSALCEDLLKDIGYGCLLTHSELVKMSNTYVECSGIYFLISDDEVVYVGQSVNVHSRVGQHYREKYKEFNSYVYIRCLESELDVLESIYIHTLRPKLQGRYGDTCSAPISWSKLIAGAFEKYKKGHEYT